MVKQYLKDDRYWNYHSEIDTIDERTSITFLGRGMSKTKFCKMCKKFTPEQNTPHNWIWERVTEGGNENLLKLLNGRDGEVLIVTNEIGEENKILEVIE